MTMPGEKPLTVIGRTNENRRASKPLMEKRRRARINHSLAELKTLILDAVKKEQQNTRHSKLEKADILEMTVKHLQNLHRQQSMVHSGNNKFTAGFKECTKEVSRFVDKSEDMEPQLRSRLLNHLTRCLVTYQNSPNTAVTSETDPLNQPDTSPSPAACSTHSGTDNSNYFFDCSSPTRPSSSSYQFNSSPQTGSRSSTPSSVQGYYPVVNAVVAPDPYDFNGYPTDNTEYVERPASPLNLVVAPKLEDVCQEQQVPKSNLNGYIQPQPKFCHNPEEEGVWRPW